MVRFYASWAIIPSEVQNDRQTRLNKLPSHNFVGFIFQALKGDIFLNDTAELQQCVEDLEVAMVTVQDDVSELETDISLIDGRLLNLETDVSLINENLINVESDVSDNENAIFGKHWEIFTVRNVVAAR